MINVGIAATLQTVLLSQSLALALLVGFVCAAYPQLMQCFLLSVILSKRSGSLLRKRERRDLKSPDSTAK